MFNDGYCPVHEHMAASEIAELKKKHPQAPVLAHPECNRELLSLADHIGSTSGIIKFATDSPDREFIIATEEGVRYALQQARSDAEFYFAQTPPVCVDMKKITLENIIKALKTGKPAMKADPDTDAQAKAALTKMLELA